MTALFVVRAVVTSADRAAFDTWYQREHLPDAMRAFGVTKAWRAWSRIDPAVHTAFYEFDSVAAAEAATAPEKLKALVAEFDRVWGTRVTRSRDVLEVVDRQGGK
jgi:hypothetical protein